MKTKFKVAVEGMGGTVYLVTEDHNMREVGKRGYIAEIGVGAGCIAQTKQEAIEIVEYLVDLQQQVEILTGELNEARREICRSVRPYNPENVEKKRGWNCFKGEDSEQ